jgi:glycosyltransferase involved in cell wall biosynthesis
MADAVTLTGRVSNGDLRELHRIGTVFCMPSPAELQSIATLEAMASGQPVVAIDAGALRELCQHERNGYICETDDSVALADGLIRILTDTQLREAMSKESLAIAKTHNITTTLERFESIYTDLINA